MDQALHLDADREDPRYDIPLLHDDQLLAL